MAKISNKTSYPSQNNITAADYLIGTSGKSTDNKQSKTFTLGDIANFTIGLALDGTAGKIPVFENSKKIGDSIISQSHSTIRIDDENGGGSLFVLGDISVSGNLTPTGKLQLFSTIEDSFGNNSLGQEVLVSRADGTVEWKHFNGSGLKYQSAWNAATNTPDLLSIPLEERNGNYWIVNVEGSTPLPTIDGGTITDWKNNDWAIISEDASGQPFWDKLDNSPEVTGSGFANQLTFWQSNKKLSYAHIRLGAGSKSFIFSSGDSATGDNSVAFGEETVAEGRNSAAFGFESRAMGHNSIAAGENALTDGESTFALGKSANAESDNAIAIGRNSSSGGSDSVAIGRDTLSDGDDAVAIGIMSEATNTNAIAIGFNNKSQGYGSYTFGAGNTSSNTNAIAIGMNCQSTAVNSIALGNGVRATGSGAVAMGTNSRAENTQSVAIGTGGQTTSSGYGSVTIGHDAVSNSANAFAIGKSVGANAHKSHVYGNRSSSFGDGVEGFSFGNDNLVYGNNAMTLGNGLSAKIYKQVVIGSNNETLSGSSSVWSSADNLLVIGNGPDVQNKSNALEVTKGGEFRLNAYGSGNVSDPSIPPTFNLAVDSSGNIVETNISQNKFIINGMVNNVGSSSSYDFMEWTSNVTSATQIPLWRTPLNFKLIKVTWAWMGDNPITAPSGSDIVFSIGSIPNGQNSIVGNYNHISDLFSIDSNDAGTYVFGEFEFTSNPITIPRNTNIGVVGVENGTIGPNNGELSISLLFVEDTSPTYINDDDDMQDPPADTF